METEEINNQLEEELENEENMTSGSVLKSMIPSMVVGTAAAMGLQELAAEYTSNPELITTAGMAGQYVGGWATYLPLHLYNHRHRLKNENGKTNWKKYFQDIGSVVASDRVGNKAWLGSYALANELSLKAGVDPALAGTISGLSSGLVYSAFTSAIAPKVNLAINGLKRRLKGGRKIKCHQVDLVRKQ
jgi:hypothetical protein